jgi:DNA-binding response OmpR family regulator
MIVFIDDEPEFISPFTDALTLSGFEVKIIADVDSAWTLVQDEKEKVDIVILDIMMPPGHLFNDEDTKHGLRTGLHFLGLMKELDERIPILCLTNADTRLFPKIDHQNYFLYEKKDLDPWRLVNLMSEIKRRKKI